MISYDLYICRLILSLARETVETRTGAVASSCRKKMKKELSSFVLGLIVQIVIRSWIGFRAKRNNIMFLQVPTYSDNATISGPGRTSRSMLITRELKPTQSLQTQIQFAQGLWFFIQTWTTSFHLTSAGPLLCTWSQLQQPGGYWCSRDFWNMAWSECLKFHEFLIFLLQRIVALTWILTRESTMLVKEQLV